MGVVTPFDTAKLDLEGHPHHLSVGWWLQVKMMADNFPLLKKVFTGKSPRKSSAVRMTLQAERWPLQGDNADPSTPLRYASLRMTVLVLGTSFPFH